MKIEKFYKYKGYTGTIEIDEVYHGKLINIPDLVTYEANTVEELYEEFKNAVNEYVDFMKDVN